MGAWRSISVQIGPRHFIRAEFERSGRDVREFRVILHTTAGPHDWLVRYETHGGNAHRHFRWCPGHHDRLHAWPRKHAAIVTRAIDDLKANWRAYDARYLAWTK